MTADINQPSWRTSSRCDSGSCVEVLVTEAWVHVRRKDDPGGPVLTVARWHWQEFIGAVRIGAAAG